MKRSDVSPALVYLGVGSNLSDPKQQVLHGIDAVSSLEGCTLLARSSLYSSPPMGPQDQPDYVNAVIAIETILFPEPLLKALQAIETRFGRVRSGLRWGARTLDLDILLYAQEIIDTADLIVPHRGIAERAFVLYPLAEIAPEIMIPGKGAIADLLENIPENGLVRID